MEQNELFIEKRNLLTEKYSLEMPETIAEDDSMIFDFLNKTKNPPKPEPIPDDIALDAYREVCRRTEKRAFRFTLDTERQPGLFDSKFGGVPYWDINRDYPVNSEGVKLMMLAQLNLETMPEKSTLPETGMLQFFISSDDDCYGMDFDHGENQDNFRVIWHETIDKSVTEEQVLSLNIPIVGDEKYEDYSPILKPCAVSVAAQLVSMGPEDVHFDDLFMDILREKAVEIPSDSRLYPLLSDSVWDTIFKDSPTGHWSLGYPYFTQTDPRNEDSPYDTLLFQMDSDSINHTEYVLWGDCGVANFFINSDDLAKRNFSRVLYNWDCC